MGEPWCLRTEVAKALRGHWRGPWDELSGECQARWLARADYVVVAIEKRRMEKKSKLVADWRDSWRWASVQLAILAPIALEGIWYVLSSMPPELRAYIRLPVFVLFAVLAVLARVWNQRKK